MGSPNNCIKDVTVINSNINSLEIINARANAVIGQVELASKILAIRKTLSFASLIEIEYQVKGILRQVSKLRENNDKNDEE